MSKRLPPLIGALLLLAGCAQAAEQYEPVVQEELYLAALRALADKRPEDAAELLTQFLKNEPRHAGAWLDLAISQCELGNAVEAERLFKEIEQRFAPPPGIMEVIAAKRASGCKPQTLRPASWQMSAARGHDSNVNQGASSANFNPGGNQGDFELAPEYLPKADSYTALSGDYFYPLDAQGGMAIAQVRLRENDHVHDQDSASVQGSYVQPWQWGKWRMRGSASASALTLGHALYQRQASVQLRAAPPLPLPEHFDLALVPVLSYAQYPTRPEYSATSGELGLNLSYAARHAQALVSLGATADHGRDDRPGGNRKGWFASAQWYDAIDDRLSTDFGLFHQHWHSSEDYAPGLIDMTRHQATSIARAAVQYAFRPHQSVQLEWRVAQNRENITLFQYNERVIQLSWRWDNF